VDGGVGSGGDIESGFWMGFSLWSLERGWRTYYVMLVGGWVRVGWNSFERLVEQDEEMTCNE
jgi:hypothetical protein